MVICPLGVICSFQARNLPFFVGHHLASLSFASRNSIVIRSPDGSRSFASPYSVVGFFSSLLPLVFL
jgi:hypothetical protein